MICRGPRPSSAGAPAVTADVRQADDIERAVRQLIGRFGAIDILINNAGVGVFRNAADMSVESGRRPSRRMSAGVLCVPRRHSLSA